MEFDIWFCRYNDKIYVVPTLHDEPPMDKPRALRAGDSPRELLRRVRKQGKKIVQVGILPPEMIGLEVEV